MSEAEPEAMATAQSGAGGMVMQYSSRMQYNNKCELLLVLVGYAVGLGNIWRFPYLCFQNGGGAFLVAYFVCLLLLGLPLFILELGLGQMFRKGTMHIWGKMGQPRLRCVGVCATLCTFAVSLYYCVVLGWTVFYLFEVIAALFTTQQMPWADTRAGYKCPTVTIYATKNPSTANKSALIHNNATDSWYNCSIKTSAYMNSAELQSEWEPKTYTPTSCPGKAALDFWNEEALGKKDNPTIWNVQGMNWKLWGCFTVGWIITYFCVFQGVASSGKIVYFTALMPYVALVAFFFRAVTLENAGVGVKFYLEPKWELLGGANIWIRASTQIFYSLGVGFGSLIAFASFNTITDNFVGNAIKVSAINCGTSFFGGFAVFPTLGFLAYQMSQVDPCFDPSDIKALETIGLQSSGLVFVAFPIAISNMPGSFFWAFLFFIMLLCLGIDSQFAMVESVITVLNDQGIGKNMKKPVFAAIVCAICWLIGTIFVTRGGEYWFNLFDYYSCVVAMFVVCFFEILGTMYLNRDAWQLFQNKVKDHLGFPIPKILVYLWSVVPFILVFLCIWAFVDPVKLTGAPYEPLVATNIIGWLLGLIPVFGLIGTFTWDYIKSNTARHALALPQAMELTASGVEKSEN